MAKWMVASKRADFDAIAKKFNIDKVIARIIRNRDIVDDEEIELFLSDDLSFLRNPLLMKDMEKASAIIKEFIDASKRIRIIGDYDVDGICSTYILLRGLKALNANVDTVIPHRIKDGYGLNNTLIDEAHEDGVDLIITCDNGISAKEQIDNANAYGIDVVVTDHHEVPFDLINGDREYILPDARAVVDPKQDDCTYPFKGICGAFVAYKLISVILNGRETKLLDELLPFAALATICDVMELKDENRILVKNGLRAMSETENLGLKALLMVNDLIDKPLSNYHMGFIIGPCLNASGRLDTAKKALDLFDAPDFKTAVTIANELKELNESRKKMTEDGAKRAYEIIELNGYKNDRVLVVYLKDTHESLAGIIAGRVKEKYNRPAFVITDAEDSVKGSGRSIEAYDMYEELSSIKEVFSKFGGHKMAAGVSLRSADDISIMRKKLNDRCTLTDDDMEKKVLIDVPMPLSYVSNAFVKALNILEPFGTGNPKPVFATKGISLLSYMVIGKNKNVAKFKIMDESSNEFDMMYFGDITTFDEFITDNFGEEKLSLLMNGRCKKDDIIISIVYYPDINVFRNKENLQIIMNDYEVMR